VDDVPRVTEVRPGLHERQRVRMRRYLALMATCLTLVVLAWTVVRFFWVELAVAMSVVAAVIPPVAAFVANRDGGG
jgi:hypothetical protein